MKDKMTTLAKISTSEKWSQFDSEANTPIEELPVSFDRDEYLPLYPSKKDHQVKPRGWGLCIVVTVATTVLVSVSSFTAGALLFRTTDASCTRQLSTDSPMLSAVEYQETEVANVHGDHTFLYMGAPTIEGDKAWNKLWDHPSFNMPEENFVTLNYSKEVEWRHTPPEFGGGIEVQAEVYHQLHCLNVLRQYTWLDHYAVPPHGFDGTSEQIHEHLDHCIEALRLSIICGGDVTVMPIKVELETMERGEPEFNTRRVCRNFDKLLEWTEENSMPAVANIHT